MVSVNERIYELRELSKHERFSREFDKLIEEEKIKKKYIPLMSHPWKIEYYRKQLKNIPFIRYVSLFKNKVNHLYNLLNHQY